MMALPHARTTIPIMEQIRLEENITLDNPDIPEDLEQHARGTTCTALMTQYIKIIPGLFPKKANDNFAIRV